MRAHREENSRRESFRKAPTTLLPPPNDLYISPALYHLVYAQGIIIRDVKHRFFTQSVPGDVAQSQSAPALGQTNVHSFGSQVDMQVSTDGGATFNPMRAPAVVTVRVTHTRDEGHTQIFETEMQQLDIEGGDLPLSIRLRESPTRRSEGGTAIAQLPPGDPDFDLLRIGSFFDVFTELTVDGGNHWSPAQLQCNAPEVTENSPALPPPLDAYMSPVEFQATFAPGIILKDVVNDRFTESMQPPPPGGSQTHKFDSRVQFMMSTDGGNSFRPGLAFAKVEVRVASSQDEGSTRYFDTEMLSLNMSGGSLPAGVMVRESPSKASLGRTSIRQGPALSLAHISSFFDVFTELSLDGGQNWTPSSSGGMDVVLRDVDSDGDGLPDDWERSYFGDLTHSPGEDVDGDGVTNLDELLAGTDPKDPSSVLRPGVGRRENDLLLSFRTVLGPQVLRRVQAGAWPAVSMADYH